MNPLHNWLSRQAGKYLASRAIAKVKATRDETTAALRADIAAGRIAHLGWKQ